MMNRINKPVEIVLPLPRVHEGPRVMHMSSGEPPDDAAETDPQPEVAGRLVVKPPDAAACIIDAAYEAATPVELRERIAFEKGLAVVVQVPTPTWVKPLEKRLDETLGRRWLTIARDGSNRGRDKNDVGNDDVAHQLSTGRCVMGIAPTASILPAGLVAAADFTIKIPPPSPAVIGAAVGRFLGEQTETPKDLAIAGIDFYGLLSAFRANSSAEDIFARLGITSATLQMRPYEDLPDLDTAVEYGAARTWALELASDFEFYKAGALQWSEIQGQASAVIHGPPGLGKTFFAKLLAKKLGVVLIAASIPDLFAKSAGYLDSVIKASQEVFDKAAATSGCVLFWDELEALPRRDSLDGRSASWWNSVVAHFLLMISEIQRPGTFLLAATNYIEKIDPALLRPGRFGKTIEIKRPDADGVVSILRHHLRGELIDTDLSELGQLAENATGAELSQMVQTARRTARYAKRPLGVDDLVSAIFPHEALNELVLRRVSLHEAGHVVVSLSEKTDKILRVAIGGMAGAFGQTTFKRETTLETRAYIEARVTNVLAGRAAEIAILGECCSGGGGDIDSDLGMATSLVASLHFSDGLAGTITYLTTREQAIELLKRDPSLRTVVERDLQRLQARAIEIVKRHRAAVEAIAAALATRRHLSGPEAEEIFKNSNAVNPLRGTIQKETPKC